MSDTFIDKLHAAVERNVLKLATDGHLVTVEYGDRVKVDRALVAEAYAAMDRPKIIERLKERLEKDIADRLYAAMASEVSNDIKRIMSNTEIRADIRVYLQSQIQRTFTELS